MTPSRLARAATALAALAALAVAAGAAPAGATPPGAAPPGAAAPAARARAQASPAFGLYAGGALRSGSLTPATGETFSSPAVGDLAGNGRLEVVAGYPDGTIHVWDAATGAQQMVIDTGPGAVDASPALVDLYHNGQLEILAANTAGEVLVYSATGQRLFSAQLPPANGLAGVFATPTVAYLDGNATPWIVVSSWNQHLYAMNLAGQEHPGFPVWFQDTSWSSPAIARLDGSGYPDIVVGYDCVGTGGDSCDLAYHRGGGYLTVLDHNGRVLPGWPRFLPGQTIWSSPAVGDLTGNGSPDVVVGTGLYWPSPAGSEVLAFTATGAVLPGWPVHVAGRVMASPALGNLTGGPGLQVAVTAENGETYLIDASGRVLWARCSITAGLPPGDPCPQSHASPVIADVAGTGSAQVIAEAAGGWTAFDAAGSALAAAYVGGSTGLAAAPTAVDLGGRATLLLTSSFSGGAHGQAGVARFTFPTPLGPAPWPTFRQDMTRSGNAAGPPGPPTGPPVAAERSWVAAAAATLLSSPWSAAEVDARAEALHDLTTTPAAVVETLAGSAQAHAAQVRLAYQQVLHRAADPAGLATWVRLLAQGSSLEQLRALLASSAEYRADHGGTDPGVVRADYELFLHRAADPAGLASWSAALARGGGARQVAAGLESSAEGRAVRVQEAFQLVLHRAADPAGLASWSAAMEHGLTLLGLEADLTLSGEFFAASQRAG